MESLDIFYNRNKGKVYFEGFASEIPDRYSQPFLQKRVEGIVGRKGLKASYDTGRRHIKPLLKTIHVNNGGDSPKDSFNLLLKALSRRGFGVLECKEFNDDFIHVTAKNCYNAVPYHKSKKPVCFEMSGILTSCGEIVTNRGMDCIETACVSKGDDTCEFHIFSNSMPEENPLPLHENNMLESETLTKHVVSYSPHRGEVLFDNAPALILPRGYLAHYQRELERLLGESADKLGYIMSKKSLAATLNSTKPWSSAGYLHPIHNSRVREMVKQTPRRGFGATLVQEMNDKLPYMRLLVKNSFNAEGYGRSSKPVCYRMAAFYAGFGTALFKTDMHCIETKCTAMGHPFCEFKLFQNPHRRINGGHISGSDGVPLPRVI